MYCGNCGALLTDVGSPADGVFCPACGVDQATGPDSMTTSEDWYYLQPQPVQPVRKGPYPFPMILSEIHTGKITESTSVWYPDMSDWCPAGQTKLARYINGVKNKNGSGQ